MSVKDLSSTTPTFTLEDYFLGETRAYGVFIDRFGNLKRRFSVTIDGTLNEQGQLVLDEHFLYADGETERRVWTITKTGANSYMGEADDIVGVASGEAAGSALNWSYDLNLKVGDSHWQVHFNDWMFLLEDGVMLNKAEVSKWGITLGEVTISFVKPENFQQTRVENSDKLAAE